MSAMEITTPQGIVTVAPQRIADMFTTSFEGGSVNWVRKATYTLRQHPRMDGPNRGPWYDDPTLYAGRFNIQITFDDPMSAGGNSPAVTVIGNEDVAKAFALMAQRYPEVWKEFLDDNEDANTADVFMQLLVLGELVYS